MADAVVRRHSRCYEWSMRATTIKVEGQLLERIDRHRPKRQTITAFVRSVLEQELRRREMEQAASEYRRFLEEHEDERAWLDDWDSADLAKPPRRRR